MRMQAAREVSRGMSLNKALRYCEMSKRAWYYVKKPRDVAIDANATDRVRGIAPRRPAYGTRRMAAQAAKETGVLTNRKKIQRIYRKIGRNESRKGKKAITRASRRGRLKSAASNHLWETDITYIHCGVGGWRYCFNVLYVFTREWMVYIFDTTATANAAIQSVLKAASSAGAIPNLRLRTDNGSQYGGRKFKKAMQVLGIRHEFVWKHTPARNRRVESFHRTPKKKCVWPHDFARFRDAKVVLAKALADCNEDRIHSARGCLTPGELVCKLEGGNK